MRQNIKEYSLSRMISSKFLLKEKYYIIKLTSISVKSSKKTKFFICLDYS